jgi:hypothetical protein
MHDLAGLKEGEAFWWEKMNCDVEGYKGNYCPNNNNVEVRREFHNFDLSIYILDSEKQAKGNQKVDGEESTDKEDINTNGERMVQKWIPVLILENKMKSLPYEEQLERYTKDAFDEWRTGKNQAVELKKTKTECGKEESIAWDTKHGINFILLSLIDNNSELGKEVKPDFNYYKNSVDISFKCIHKSYADLKNNLEKTLHYDGFKEGLNKSIVEDYNNFIEALYNLASNYWTINPGNGYRLQIFPWNIDNNKDAEDKRNEIEKYKKLRIHDIHEKLLYDQLLSELEKYLRDKGLEYRRFDQKTILAQNKENEPIRIYTNSGYAHGVGLFEVQYILSKDFKPIGTNDKELFKLIIQVQGDRYCHMVVYDNIVDDADKKNLKVNTKVLNTVWKEQACLKQDISKPIEQYISISDKAANFPILGQAIGSNPSFGKYGKNLIYQWVEIPADKSINDVINAIINDVSSIRDWFNPLKKLP